MDDKSNSSGDHQEILRYLRKQMDDEELAKFEVRLMNDLELLRETQREDALLDALRERQEALFCIEAKPKALGFREWLIQPMTAAAAALVLLVSIPTIGLQLAALREQSIEGLQIASSQYVEGLRSSAQSLSVAGDFPMLLHIDAGPESLGKIFTVQLLQRESADIIFQHQGLTSGPEGYLSLLLREELTGDFQILVYPGTELSSESAASYEISIR